MTLDSAQTVRTSVVWVPIVVEPPGHPRPADDPSPHHVNTAALQTVRGPGQAALDPLQFVSTSAAPMAESARQLITITEQQKRERAKLAQHGVGLSEYFNE
ncbi:unnamed protein product [Heligmosomoides polygyrus]|uniref:Uncharacterized protein n=1 Tax=Heligmosomoides polygyrus TaxID=6339 RepID=A0A183FEU1_HELPZ|nr:unnamed protein product [Heligmosomoides polygyrus]